MSNFSYENQGAKTFLVYTVQPEDQIDSMSLGMLTNNRITGLASTLLMQLDNTKFIKYDVSGKVALTQFFTGAVNRKRLLGVFNGIADAMLNAEEYMIDTRSILLDHDHIYADVSTCETELICVPVANSAEQPNMIDFFKQIMFSTQFDQTENLDHVAKIINYLNSAPVFSLLEFKSVLKTIESGAGAAAPARQPVVKPAQQAAPTVRSRVQPPVSVQPTVQQPKAQHAAPQATVLQGPPPQQSPAAAPQQAPAPQSAAPVSDEPEISLYYLLQHYNKDNAAAYKAQKEARKAAKANGKPEKGKKEKPEKGKKEKPDKKGKKNAAPAQKPSYAVPGAPVNYAVPGQQSAPVSAPAAPQAAAAPVTQPTAAQPQPQPQAPSVSAYQAAAVPHSAPGNFGETVVLNAGGAGETTVLTTVVMPNSTKPMPYLIRLSNNERIPVNKPVFRIGKERSYVDYFIGDNSAISRSHANILQREDRYFIMDTNSKNHTYVDGSIIPSNAEIEIVNGTKLRLANEDFEFQIL